MRRAVFRKAHRSSLLIKSKNHSNHSLLLLFSKLSRAHTLNIPHTKEKRIASDDSSILQTTIAVNMLLIYFTETVQRLLK